MKFILKNRHNIIVFLVSIVISAFLSNLATSAPSFDNQAITTWDALAKNGYFPYRDIYYPYGILYFFKNVFILFKILYLLIFPAITTGFFILFNKLTKNILAGYILTVSILLFILFHIDITTFSRYGSLLILILYYCYFFFTHPKPSKKTLFLLGFINGLYFSLIYDQGILSILFYLFILLTHSFINHQSKQSAKTYFALAKHAFVFLTGTFAGVIPFMIYLIKTNSLTYFINSVIQLKDIIYYAKTPFFNFLFTPPNLFIFFSIFLSIWLIIYHFYKRINPSFAFNSIFYLTTLLIFLQTKSIIRSIANDLSFIALLLFLINVIYIINYLHAKKTLSLFIKIVTIFLFIVVFYATKIIPLNISFSSNEIIKNNKNYHDVIIFLKTIHINNDARIFSYPGNPIFYIALNKKPPYYFSTYEGSPSYAQKERLSFLKNQKTSYVILDNNMLAIQDGVPEYVRSSEELKYILTHFYPIKQIDNFIILQRNINNSPININLFNPKLKSYLMDIDLKNIPNAQGRYVYKKGSYKQLATLTNPNELSMQIINIENNTKNNDILLALFSSSKEKTYTMTITNPNIISHITFYSCQNNPCIINLAKLPIFYLTTKHDNFVFNFSDPLEKIDIFTVKSSSAW